MLTKNLIAAAALAIAPVAVEASPIYAPVPTDNYITYMGADWAWASPCAADGNSCSQIDFSYQSTFGWRLPTAAEIAAAITADISAFVAAFGVSSDFKCASAWFDMNYSHCDYSDAAAGYIWGTPSAGGYYDETFVIRGAVSAVPVPAAGLMLISGLAGVAALRRRAKTGAAA